MSLEGEGLYKNIESQHNFILIYNNDDYEIKDFIGKYLNIINKKYSHIIYIHTKEELFSYSKLNNNEQLFMLKKIFKIDEKDLPVCLYVGDFETNECTSYSLKNITSNNINTVFTNTIESLGFKNDLLSKYQLNNLLRSNLNKAYLNYFNKLYKELSDKELTDKALSDYYKALTDYKSLIGLFPIKYYLNRCIIDRTLFDEIGCIYKEIEVLYENIKYIKDKCSKTILEIQNNKNDVDILNKLEEIYYECDKELIEINYLISEKQNLIDEKYKEMSLSKIKLIECCDYKKEIHLTKNDVFKFVGGCISGCIGGIAKKKNKIKDNILYYNKEIYKQGEINFELWISKYTTFLEDNSIKMIKSCKLTEECLCSQLNLKDEDIDFSVCACGYWKAIEIELNIIFIDTIRKNKGIINEIPSNGISYKKGEYNIFSGYRINDKNNKIPQTVNINKLNNGKLCPCMLGELINISKNYNNNELNEIIYDIYKTLKDDKIYQVTQELKIENIEDEIAIFMDSIVSEMKVIVYKYRNKYTHTEFMTKDELERLKKILFGKDGLYYKIVLLKSMLVK